MPVENDQNGAEQIDNAVKRNMLGLDNLVGMTKGAFQSGKQTVQNSPVMSSVASSTYNAGKIAVNCRIGKEALMHSKSALGALTPADWHPYYDTPLGKLVVAEVCVILTQILKEAGMGEKTEFSLALLGDVKPVAVLEYVADGMLAHAAVDGLQEIDVLELLNKFLPIDMLKRAVADMQSNK